MTDRGDDALAARAGLPDALRALIGDYPRDGWEAHPNFNEMTRFWMDRHIMFRKLNAMMIADAEAAVEAKIEARTHAMRLSRLGNSFLGDLHLHHSIEDAHYFPRLTGLEPGLDHGFALLEADHHEIHAALDRFAELANAVLGGAEAGPLLDGLRATEALLDRHLTDEEDLIVPVILKTGFRIDH